MSVGAQDADIGREGTGFGGVGNAGQALCVRVSSVKNLPAMQEIACNSGDLGLILGLEDPLEE